MSSTKNYGKCKGLAGGEDRKSSAQPHFTFYSAPRKKSRFNTMMKKKVCVVVKTESSNEKLTQIAAISPPTFVGCCGILMLES